MTAQLRQVCAAGRARRGARAGRAAAFPPAPQAHPFSSHVARESGASLPPSSPASPPPAPARSRAPAGTVTMGARVQVLRVLNGKEAATCAELRELATEAVMWQAVPLHLRDKV